MSDYRRGLKGNEDTTMPLPAALGSYHFLIGDIPKADNNRAYHASTVGNFKASKHCKVRLCIGDVFVPYTNHVGDIPRADNGSGLYLKEALVEEISTSLPSDTKGRNIKNITVLFSEPEVYQMLLQGHAPQSEPFRKWVTEVVLPSIRKTGKFDANEAQDKESIQLSGEFAQLHAAISELTVEVRSGPPGEPRS